LCDWVDRIELQEIVVSVVAIAFAFTVFRSRDGLSGVWTPDFWVFLVMALLTVGLGFVLHELAHRYVARSYGAYAVYRAWPAGLALMLGLAVIGGVLFAAPGAVYIYSRNITRKENGIISVAGPATNLALGVAFGFAYFLVRGSPDPVFQLVGMAFSIGFKINVFLALFNMIPIFPLDGGKVFAWNKIVWGSVVASCIVLLFGPLPL
jgi:Zn-dependent protease